MLTWRSNLGKNLLELLSSSRSRLPNLVFWLLSSSQSKLLFLNKSFISCQRSSSNNKPSSASNNVSFSALKIDKCYFYDNVLSNSALRSNISTSLNAQLWLPPAKIAIIWLSTPPYFFLNWLLSFKEKLDLIYVKVPNVSKSE